MADPTPPFTPTPTAETNRQVAAIVLGALVVLVAMRRGLAGALSH